MNYHDEFAKQDKRDKRDNYIMLSIIVVYTALSCIAIALSL